MLEASNKKAQRRRRKTPLTPEEQWVRQLGSQWPPRRKRARLALAERGPAILDLLLAMSQRDDQARRSFMRRHGLYTGLLLLGSMVIEWLGTDPFPTLPRSGAIRLLIFIGACIIVNLGAAIAVVANALSAISPILRHIELVELLAAMDDTRVCGPLAESLKISTQFAPKRNRATRQAAEAALVRLLPQLTEQNIPDWNASQRSGLRTVLKRAAKATVITPEAARLVCASLEASAILGDLQAQNIVAQLAKRNPKNDTEIQVVEAAQRCETALQQWQERNRNGEMLLRGSAMPTTAPETLLRVAPTAVREEPQQLLRASATEETIPQR